MKITQYLLFGFLGLIGAIASPALAFTITSEQQYKVDAEHTLFITHFSFNILNRDVAVPMSVFATNATTTHTELFLSGSQSLKQGLLLTDTAITNGRYEVTKGTEQSFVLVSLIRHDTNVPSKLLFSTPVFIIDEPDRKPIIFSNRK